MRTYIETYLMVAALGMASSFAGCNTTGSGQQAGDPAAAEGAEPAAAPAVFDEMPPVGTKARCPVMGGEFEVTADTQHSTYKGKTYVFCCPGCKPQFDADPEKYI